LSRFVASFVAEQGGLEGIFDISKNACYDINARKSIY
jgi:hypothetical protein